MWKEWVNGVLGLVIIVAAFINLTGAAYTWSFLVLGVIVAVLGFWGAAADSSTSSMRPAMR